MSIKTVWTKASAAKRGRNPKFPYVPVLLHGWQHDTSFGPQFEVFTREEQLRGFAFVARAEAVAYAQKTIDFRARDK